MPTTSIFEQNIHFIFAFKTYSESDDKSDLKEYPKLSNFLIYRSFTKVIMIYLSCYVIYFSIHF